MKKSSWIKFLFGIGIVLAIVAGCGSDGKSSDNSSSAATAENGKTKSYLFVQNATSGTFVPDGNGSYTLTLNGVSPQTIYFSDRPVRDAGQVAMQKFLDSMCFNSSNPPNAAIDVLGADKANDVAIVELINPRYSADTSTLIYTAHILNDTNISVSSLNERNDASIPASFKSVALFIDDCSNLSIVCGVNTGYYDAIKPKGKVSCCQCWGSICNFQQNCCSFERCQKECTDKYGKDARYLKLADPGLFEGTVFVDNADDWYWDVKS